MSVAVAEPKPTTTKAKAKPEPATAPSPMPIAMKACHCGASIAIFADGDGSDEELALRYGTAWQREGATQCKTCESNAYADARLAQIRRQNDAAVFNQQVAFVRAKQAKQLAECGLWGDLPEVSRTALHRIIESSPSRGDRPTSLMQRKWSATIRRVVELLDGFDEWQVTEGN